MDIPENSINEILENNPSQGTLYVLLEIMNENGKFNFVIRECLRALKRFPDDLVIKKLLAEAYLAEGRLPEAEAEFKYVADGIKSLAGAFKSQAEIYVRQKRENEAVASLKQYLALIPDDEDSALLLEELEKTKEALVVDAIEEQADTEIPEPEVTEEAEVIESEEPVDADITEAIEFPEDDIIISKESDDFPEIITASLAETYFDQGKLAEAREIYEKLADKDPEDMAVKSRINEISALMEPEDEPEEIQIENKVRRKKEKMISVLDSWRSNIRELSGEGVS